MSKSNIPDLKALLAKRGLLLSDLAAKLGVAPSQPTRWHYKGVPLCRVLDVEKASGIKRKLLRPDLFQ